MDVQVPTDDARAAVEDHGAALLLALSPHGRERFTATEAWTMLNADREGRRKLVEFLATKRIEP